MSRRYDNESDYDPGEWSVNNRRLRRNKIDGVLGGVCAGIGDWLGLGHGLTRVLFVLLVVFTFVPGIIYILLWIFIPSDKRAPYVREDREQRRAVRSGEPMDNTTYGDVRSKFRSLEERLQDLERSVTSREWRLRRDFRDLEG